jgi:hypothetical protein
MFMQASDYPLELLHNAELLMRLAVEEEGKREEPWRGPLPCERAFARASIFTSVNALESLFIDVVQRAVAAASPRTADHDEMANAIKQRRAKVTDAFKKWPQMLGKSSITQATEFGRFDDVMTLRNQFAHPKLDTDIKDALAQDGLIKKATGAKAKEVFVEVLKMMSWPYLHFTGAVPADRGYMAKST